MGIGQNEQDASIKDVAHAVAIAKIAPDSKESGAIVSNLEIGGGTSVQHSNYEKHRQHEQERCNRLLRG